MLDILSWNVNGFRSILEKGCWDELLRKQYDIICFQEVKLSDAQKLREMLPEKYKLYFNLSKEKGRNGVAVYSKMDAKHVTYSLGHQRFDAEGRYIKLEYEDFVLINLYMPHGRRDKSQLKYKLEIAGVFCEELMRITCPNIIIATDFNIASDSIDVCRADQNEKNIMFTEAERQILHHIFDMGYKDSFRELYPCKVEYTWWSYAFDCRGKNIGWRIDYFLVTSNILQRTEEVEILKDQMGSDHCPSVIRIKGELK